jgi:hypothetical protein
VDPPFAGARPVWIELGRPTRETVVPGDGRACRRCHERPSPLSLASGGQANQLFFHFIAQLLQLQSK